METPTNGVQDKPTGLNLAAIATKLHKRGGSPKPDPPSTNGSKPDPVRELEKVGVLETEEEDQPAGERNTERRFRRYAIASHDLDGNLATILHAVALRSNCYAESEAAYHDRTLAGDVNLRSDTVATWTARAEQRGLLWQADAPGTESKYRVLTTRLGEAEKTEIRGSLWQAYGPEEPSTWREWRYRHDLIGALHGHLRNRWKHVFRDPDLRGDDLKTSAVGVGLTAELLCNRKGLCYRQLDKGDLAALSGYSQETVRRRLRDLERKQWLWVDPQAGRGGGLVVGLRIPNRLIERAKLP